MGRTARLIYDESENNSDLYYLSGFLAGDPFLYLEIEGETRLYLSDLEVDRGRSTSSVDQVERLQAVVEAIKDADPDLAPANAGKTSSVLRRIAHDHGIDGFEVPGSFPVGLADTLRGLGVGLRWLQGSFAPARLLKTPEEVEHIRTAIQHTQAAMQAAIDQIARATIRGDTLYEGAEPLTAEAVKRTIHSTLLERECFGPLPIVAGGEQAVDPHDRGSGPLPANRPIILDIFPRHMPSRYHGDMTRTVVRGKASDEVKRMHKAVFDAKAAAEALVRDEAQGQAIHKAVQAVFDDAGFETGEKDGRMVGFFHGTGHGLGLDIHEAPRIAKGEATLRAGHVVTIEPGLYYPGLGGVRIEDDVLVTATGCDNLCDFDQERLEV